VDAADEEDPGEALFVGVVSGNRAMRNHARAFNTVLRYSPTIVYKKPNPPSAM
jgi:hypothetical protein